MKQGEEVGKCLELRLGQAVVYNTTDDLSSFCTIKQAKVPGVSGEDQIVKTKVVKEGGKKPCFNQRVQFANYLPQKAGPSTCMVHIKLWNDNEPYDNDAVNPIGALKLTKQEINSFRDRNAKEAEWFNLYKDDEEVGQIQLYILVKGADSPKRSKQEQTEADSPVRRTSESFDVIESKRRELQADNTQKKKKKEKMNTDEDEL